MHLDTKQGRERGSDASDSSLPSAPPPKLVTSAVAPPPPPPRQSTSPPGSVGSGASADEPGVLKGDPFALTRQTLKRHTRAQAAGEENRAPPAPRGRA